MALAPGEYEFTCMDCDGKGIVDVIQVDGRVLPEDCEDCDGSGVVRLEEDEAQEMVDFGRSPLRGPL
ncbi:MAG: hypothetical protein GC157_02330 [Frankiales bacterium]|nr:hypothetical protein [Frankiales bacterium]